MNDNELGMTTTSQLLPIPPVGPQVGDRVFEPNDPLAGLMPRSDGTIQSIKGDTAYVLWDMGSLSPVPLVELEVIQ